MFPPPWFRVKNVACDAHWYASNAEYRTGQKNLRIGYCPRRQREKEIILVKVDYDQNLNEPNYCRTQAQRVKPFDQGTFEYVIAQVEHSDFGKMHCAGSDAIL